MSNSEIQNPDWMKLLSRLGYLSKGVVYLVIGAVVMTGVSSTDKQEAMGDIARQPFGKALLSLTAVGLFAYALWRLASGLVDPHDRSDDNAKGVMKRTIYIGSAALYFTLSWSAARIVMGVGEGGGNGTADWTSSLLAMPWGRILVTLVAVAILVAAGYQFKKAWTASFKKEFRVHSMSSLELKWATRIGRVGHVARAVIYALISWLFVLAAAQQDAQEAGGLSKALGTLHGLPFGQAWLVAVGAGLVCYSLYCFVAARYRRADA